MATNKRLRDVLEKSLGPLTFGGYMRGARVMKDKSQVEMAKFLGMSKSTLCDIEKGRQGVTPGLAAKIARKCGFPEIVAVELAINDQLRRAGLKWTVKAS